MDVTSILFYVFSAVLLGAAFMVVTARNTVHATLFLMLGAGVSRRGDGVVLVRCDDAGYQR